jgi:hypothetical protein
MTASGRFATVDRLKPQREADSHVFSAKRTAALEFDTSDRPLRLPQNRNVHIGYWRKQHFQRADPAALRGDRSVLCYRVVRGAVSSLDDCEILGAVASLDRPTLDRPVFRIAGDPSRVDLGPHLWLRAWACFSSLSHTRRELCWSPSGGIDVDSRGQLRLFRLIRCARNRVRRWWRS